MALHMVDELFNEDNVSIIDQTCSKDILVHVPGGAGDLKGTEAFKRFARDFVEAFEITHLHVDDLTTEDSKIAVQTTITATSTKAFFGMPPTGKQITMKPKFLFKFGPDGKVAELWQMMDIKT